MLLSTLAKEINATLIGPDRELPPLVIDSRKIQGGELFAALKGENHDGHDYIIPAIEQGAVAVLTEKVLSEFKQVSFLQVKDTTQALGEWGAFWRSRFPVPMIGVTGSCGKTTVKGMLESICQQQGKTLATQGNFNNHIGLPLTLLRLDASYQYAVIEMGANHVGEIRYLGKLAQPQISLITNVKPAHLEGFISEENVAKAKGEIYEILPENGTAILNLEEPFCSLWRGLVGSRRIITVGKNEKANVWASDIELHADCVEFTLHLENKMQYIKINIPGRHTVMNALCAIAGAYALGISSENIAAGLINFQGVPGRLRRFQGLNGALIIDDTYNANPGSMIAALDVLAHCQGQKMFVMGDMGELGTNASLYHTQIGEYAKSIGIDRLFAVGKLSEHAVHAFGSSAKMYASKEALVSDLNAQLNSQTVILIKGSRSAKMEVITNALRIQEGA